MALAIHGLPSAHIRARWLISIAGLVISYIRSSRPQSGIVDDSANGRWLVALPSHVLNVPKAEVPARDTLIVMKAVNVSLRYCRPLLQQRV